VGIQIIDFEFQKENNQIIVIFRQPNGFILPIDGGPPDKIWKEIYGIKDGKIILQRRIDGKHIPAMWIEEKIIFDELE
jgi:hypothetical protein